VIESHRHKSFCLQLCNCQKLIRASLRGNASGTIYPPDAGDRFWSLNLIHMPRGSAPVYGPADRVGSNAVFCSCATTGPVGQGPLLRIARAARKPCASPERRGGSTVYPICTYLNAERARRPIPRKELRQPKPKQRQKSAPGISTSLVTQHAKSRDAAREQKGSQSWMRRKGIVGVQRTNLARDRC
jgi:hypothetical protein